MHEAEKKELTLRVLSAVVLAPVALAAIYLGTPYLEAVLTIASLAMVWEWERLCGGRRFGLSGIVAAAAIAVVGVAGWLRRYDLAVVALVLGTVGAFAAAAAARRGSNGWISSATAVIGLPCLAIIWLRADPDFGLRNVMWLVGTVWATDIGGYTFGRLIGGARLAPAISPGKTWSGLSGAIVIAAVWGFIWGLWAGAQAPWFMALLSGGAAVVAQGGDLGVSFVKRRFGAKDASNLIPGHGGVLDRFDGMLPTALVLALTVLVTHRGMFLWR